MSKLLKTAKPLIADLEKLGKIGGLSDEEIEESLKEVLTTLPALCSLIITGGVDLKQAKKVLSSKKAIPKLSAAIASESSRIEAIDKVR